jgi:uncharacterized protein YdaL
MQRFLSFLYIAFIIALHSCVGHPVFAEDSAPDRVADGIAAVTSTATSGTASGTPSGASAPAISDPNSGAPVVEPAIAPVPPGPPKCVQIYYDRTADPNYSTGRLHAIMVANLLGHFPNWQRVISPIEKYYSGDLDKCQVNFYIGSFYDNPLPEEFLREVGTTHSRVVWMGYGFWNIPEFEKSFGIEFQGLGDPEGGSGPSQATVGFFNEVEYRGEMFSRNVGSAEIARVKVIDQQATQALVYAKHSSTGERIPWAIQSKNKFLLTEVPLTFISESDRYLVFSDLLFDILEEKPRREKNLAVIRLEDIHSFTNRRTLDRAFAILKSAGAYPALSVIPVFHDPNKAFAAAGGVKDRTLSQDREFMKKLRGYQADGATLIWHGVTHQNDEAITPAANGVSGEDFEFWNNNDDQPLKGDSGEFVLNRISVGAREFSKFGYQPSIWITPHYKASALSSTIFGKLFPWTMGRMIYSASYFSSLVVDELWTKSSDLTEAYVPQFFPFEIYGDYYGQNVLPENLGNAQPTLNKQVVATRSVEQILESARKVSVLRDAWASAFFHSYLLENESKIDEETTLFKLVHGLKELNFEFVDLKNFGQNFGRDLKALPLPIIER